MKSKSLSAAILAFALVSPVITQAQQVSSLEEVQGPATGILAGGIIGGSVGAVVGAIAGAFIGHIEIQKDALTSAEEKLAASENERTRLAGQLEHQQTLVATTQDWDKKRQSLQENFAFCMQFRTASASLEPRYHKQLHALARVMQTFPEFDIQVAASADKRGSADYNQKLKKMRADNVIAQLISAGVDENRIQNADNTTLQPSYSVEDVEGLGFDRFAVISFVPSSTDGQLSNNTSKQQPVLASNVQP